MIYEIMEEIEKAEKTAMKIRKEAIKNGEMEIRAANDAGEKMLKKENEVIKEQKNKIISAAIREEERKFAKIKEAIYRKNDELEIIANGNFEEAGKYLEEYILSKYGVKSGS